MLLAGAVLLEIVTYISTLIYIYNHREKFENA
jgi:hypothetical protein